MRNYREFISTVSLMVIVSLLYTNIVWALPSLDRETLAPPHGLQQELARLDIKASLLLGEVFDRFRSSHKRVDLELLLEWVNTSTNLHNALTVHSKGQKILILAKGFNIEFSTTQLDGGHKLPNSDIWVRINYYSSSKSKYPYDFSIHTRERNLKALSQKGEPLDILVIGGGIVGAGIARDASLRGLKVGLVEKGDFASGTSSRSSRLIHAGLRYLGFIPEYLKLAFAEREFIKYLRLIWHDSIKLVFEASRERRILLRIAPHLVRPLRFLIPVYKNGLFKIFLGTWLYDLLSLFRNTRIHRTLFSGRSVTNVEGSVNKEGLKGGSLYYDASVNDSRLVLENILSANGKGALIANYAEVVAITYDGNGKANGTIVEDKMTGQTYTIKARKVINAAGPWIHKIRKLDTLAEDGINELRLVEGSHIIVPRISNNAVVIFADDGRRIIFVIPMDENRSLIGTTERDFDKERENLDNPQPTEEEIDYLLANANRVFPNARLTRDSIIQATAGVRPLAESIGGMVDANLVSRAHEIQESSSGLISVSGVKLTTYRSVADSVVTRILKEIRPLDRTECTTDKIPLYGGERVKYTSQAIAGKYGIDIQTAEYMVNKYGSKYTKVLGLTRNHPELVERIIPHKPYILAEIVYAVHFEMTIHLQDFVMRRTDIDLQEGITMADIWKIARLLGAELGWTENQIAEEVKDYLKHSWRMRQRKSASAKFKGVPVVEEEVSNIIKRSDIEEVGEGELDDIEGLLNGIVSREHRLDLPPNLGEIIYKEVFKLSKHADDLVRYIYEGTEKPETGQAENDISMSERLKAEIEFLFPAGCPSQIKLEGISWQEILEQFRLMRRNKTFKTFTPRYKKDLEYFLRSPSQHTIAVLLRAKIRKVITSGTCFLLGSIWKYLGSISNRDLRRRLRSALILHEVIEELLYRKKIRINGAKRDTPELVAHYIAEIVERIILGDEPYNLEKESTLDVEIKNYFSGHHQQVLDGLPTRLHGEVMEDEWIPPTIPGWVKERLLSVLKEFSKTVSRDVLEMARERCLAPYHIGIIELIKSLRDEKIRLALEIGKMEASDLVGLLMNLFITPQSEELLEEFTERFRDIYRFPALLKLYIDSKITKTIRYERRPVPYSGDFLKIDPASVRDILRKKAKVPRQPGGKRIVSLQGLGSSRERYDVHLHVLLRRIQNAVIEEVSNQTGIGLNREVLIKALKNVLYSIQAKVPAVGGKLFKDLAGKKYLQIIFVSDDPSADYLFGYNKKTGEIRINIDALMVIENPEIIEVLLAVGLLGNLLLGYSDYTIDILQAWYGYLKTGEKRDLTPEGILTRQAVEDTMYLLNQYHITPANLVYALSRIVVPGERYSEGIIGYTRSLEQFILDPAKSHQIDGTAIPEISRNIRGRIYGREGELNFRLPLGTIVEPFYIMLARAISEEILSTHIPAGIRAGFIDQFAKELTNVLMPTAQRAWDTKTEEDIGTEGEWIVKWDIREGKVIFAITYLVGENKDVPIEVFYRDTGYFDSIKLESGTSPLWLSPFETIVLTKDIPSEMKATCGMIGKDIDPKEVQDLKTLADDERRMVNDAIANIERILEEKRNDEVIKPYIQDIEGYIRALRKLLGQGRIYKFDAIVRGPEEFLLGFADKRGIALCNEFFQKDANLNTLLDEALFHEAYHLKNIRIVNLKFVHDEARRLQEGFFTDEMHYASGDESLAERSKLRKYARELINNSCKETSVEAPAIGVGDEPARQVERLADYNEYSGDVDIKDVSNEQLTLVSYEAVKDAISDIESRLARNGSKLIPGEVDAIRALVSDLHKTAKGEKRISKLYSFKSIVRDEDSWIVFFQDPSRGIVISEEFLDKGHPGNRFLSQILFHLGYHMQGPDLIALGIRPEDVHGNALRIERILFDDEEHYWGPPDSKTCQLAEAIKELVISRIAPPVQEAEVPVPEEPLPVAAPAPLVSREPVPIQVPLPSFFIEPAPEGARPDVGLGKGVTVFWEPYNLESIKATIIEDGVLKHMEVAIISSGESLGKYYIYSGRERSKEGEAWEGIVCIGHFIAYKKEGRSYITFHISPRYLHYFSFMEVMKATLGIIATNLNLDIVNLQVQIDNPAFGVLEMVRDGIEIMVPILPLATAREPMEPRYRPPVEELEKVSVEEGIRKRSVKWGGQWGDRLYTEEFYYRRTSDFGIEICERMLPKDPQNVRKMFDMVLAAIEAIQNCPGDRFSDSDLRTRLGSIKEVLLKGIDKIVFMPSVVEGSDYSFNLQEREEEGRRQKVLFIYTNKLVATGFNGFVYIFLKYFFIGTQLSSASFAEIRNAVSKVLEDTDIGGESDIVKLLRGVIVRPVEQEPEYVTLNLGDKIKIEHDDYGSIGNILIGERLVSFFFLERLFPELRGFLLKPPSDIAVTKGRIRLPEEKVVPGEVLEEDFPLLHRIDYTKRSGLVESEDIVAGKRDFYMFYRELNDVAFELDIEEGIGLDRKVASEFFGVLLSAMDSILNLPDSGLIRKSKGDIVNNFNIVRFEKGDSKDSIDISLQYDGKKVVLIFKLPNGFIRAVDKNMLILCLLIFFQQDRVPGWGVEKIPIRYFTDDRDLGDPVRKLYHDVLGELRSPGGTRKSVRFKSGLAVNIDGRGRIIVQKDDEDIPLVLLEKTSPGFRREVLVLSKVKAWLSRRMRGFRGYIRKDHPAREGLLEDPKDVSGGEKIEIGVDADKKNIVLDGGFEDIIRNRFSGIDVEAIKGIIYRAFSQRLEMFDNDKDLVDRIKAKKISFHLINQSRSLFGDHTENGKVWMNIVAVLDLVQHIEDEKTKAIILGIIFGIGLSHEILGHEAGIRDDELLTVQDAQLTMRLIKENGLVPAYYIERLLSVLEEDSPYIKQIKAIVVIGEEIPQLSWKESGIGRDQYVINTDIGEIGYFVIEKKKGTTYIKFYFEKPYSYLMLLSRPVMAGLVGNIVDRLGLDINRVIIQARKTPVELIPIERDDRVVLVPCLRLDQTVEGSGETEEIIFMEGMKGMIFGQKGKPLKATVYYLKIGEFTLGVKSDGQTYEFLRGFLEILGMIFNIETDDNLLLESVGVVKDAIGNKYDEIIFWPATMKEAAVGIMQDVHNERRLLIVMDEDLLSLDIRLSKDILLYSIFKFFTGGESIQKITTDEFNEAMKGNLDDISARLLREIRKGTVPMNEFSITLAGDNVRIGLGPDGRISKVMTTRVPENVSVLGKLIYDYEHKVRRHYLVATHKLDDAIVGFEEDFKKDIINLYRKILNYNDPFKGQWDGVDVIFNLPEDIQAVEEFKAWIRDVDVIRFDTVNETDPVSVELKEKTLIIKVPVKVVDEKKNIRVCVGTAELVTHILLYFYNTKGITPPDDIKNRVSAIIHEANRARWHFIDLGNGLIAEIGSNKWVRIRKDGSYVPLILIEKLMPGLRRFLLGLPRVTMWLNVAKAFQARLKKEFIEPNASVIEIQDVLEIAKKGDLVKKQNFEKFCESVDLDPVEVEKILRVAFKYRAVIAEHQTPITNLNFRLSAQYENPFGNGEDDGIVTLNQNALKRLPREVRLIALAVGLSHEILGHEAGIDDEGLLSSQDVEVTTAIIGNITKDFGQQIVLYLRYLESLRAIVEKNSSQYLDLLSQDYEKKGILPERQKVRAKFKISHGKTNERRLAKALKTASQFNEYLNGKYLEDSTYLVPDVDRLDTVEIRVTSRKEVFLFWVDKGENIIYINERLISGSDILLSFLLRHALDYLSIEYDGDKADLRRNDLEVYFSLEPSQQEQLAGELDRFGIFLIDDITGERLRLESEYYKKYGKYRWQDELRENVKRLIGKAMDAAIVLGMPNKSCGENVVPINDLIYRLRNLMDIILSLPDGVAIHNKLKDLIVRLEDLSGDLMEHPNEEISIEDLTRLAVVSLEFISIANEIIIPAIGSGSSFHKTFFSNLMLVHPQIDFVIIYAKEKLPKKLRDAVNSYLGNGQPIHIRYTRQGRYYTVILAIPRKDGFSDDIDKKLEIPALKNLIGHETDIVRIQAIFNKRELNRPPRERDYSLILYNPDGTSLPLVGEIGLDAGANRIIQWIGTHEQKLSNWDRIKGFLSTYWKKEPVKLLLGIGILSWISFIWIIFKFSTFNSPFAYLGNAMLTGLTFMLVIFIFTVIYHLILGGINWKNPFLAKEISKRSRWVWGIGFSICIAMIALWPILGDVYLLALEAPYLHEALHVLPLTLAIGAKFGGIVLNEGLGIIGTLLSKLSPFISESIRPLHGFAMQRYILDTNLINDTMARFLSPAIFLLPSIIDLAIASIFVRKGNEKRNPVLIGYGLFLIVGTIIYFGMHGPIGDFAMGGSVVYNIFSNPNFNPRYVPILKLVTWQDYYSLLIIIPITILISLAISSVSKVINSIKEKLGNRWFWSLLGIVTVCTLLSASGFRIIITALIGLTVACGVKDFIYGIHKRVKPFGHIPMEKIAAPPKQVELPENLAGVIAEKIISKDRNLVLLNNFGLINLLTGKELSIPVYTRFRSTQEAMKCLNKEEVLKLVVLYYIMFAKDILGDRPVSAIPNGEPRITDDDLVRALVDKLRDVFGIELNEKEYEFLFTYVRNRWLYRDKIPKMREESQLSEKERIRREMYQKLETRISARLKKTRTPGMLYFDLDKIFESDPITAAMYTDLLEELAEDKDYCVVIVNSYPNRSINQILGKYPGLINRFRRLERKGVILDASRIDFSHESRIGERLIEKAIGLAKAKLKVDSMPKENIALAIYAPNRWIYPEDFLRDFSVVIMTARFKELDSGQLRALEKFLPGIGRLVEENREFILANDIYRLSGELERLEREEEAVGTGA